MKINDILYVPLFNIYRWADKHVLKIIYKNMTLNAIRWRIHLNSYHIWDELCSMRFKEILSDIGALYI